MDRVDTFYGHYYDVPGRNIVRTYGHGKWSPEHVRALTDDVIKVSKNFYGKWAYIADPTGINNIIPKETSAEFVKLHERVEAAGCRAIAFLDGNTAAMKLQSQKHQDTSDTEMLVGHFRTEQEALDWIAGLGI